MERITGRLMGEDEKPWTTPSIEKRSQFLEQMLQLSQRISTLDETKEVQTSVEEEQISIHPDLTRLHSLIEAGDASEAFFLARRLVSQGEEWAEEWISKAKNAF